MKKEGEARGERGRGRSFERGRGKRNFLGRMAWRGKGEKWPGVAIIRSAWGRRGRKKGGRVCFGGERKRGERWQGKREQKKAIPRPGGVFSGCGDYSECLGAVRRRKRQGKTGGGGKRQKSAPFFFFGADSAGRAV